MSAKHTDLSLNNDEIERYSRQLIIPDFGIENQLKLKAKSALIIGCGGLGCPSALYLSSSGIGKLGLLDNDSIEITNIHRQIAHNIESVGRSKARNLADKCKSINDKVEYEVYECLFDKSIATSIVKEYDVILDCTDNVITRYLINDTCVLLNKALVSGSALKFEGQLTVYNYLNGPCYRCLYPIAPKPETVSNCSDSGILGPIVGMIGSLQALEAIKILTNIGTTLSNRMLVFDGLDFQLRLIKLRPKQIETCMMCKHIDNKLSLDEINNKINAMDYNLFCGVSNYNDKTLNINILKNETQRISCDFFKKNFYETENSKSHILIDCRPKYQFQICSLRNSINIPFDNFQYEKEAVLDTIKQEVNKLNTTQKKSSLYLSNIYSKFIYLVENVRIVLNHLIKFEILRGNDSQFVVEMLNKYFLENDSNDNLNIECIKDIIGGLQAWSEDIDPQFPKY